MEFVEQVPDDCQFKVDFSNPSFYDLSGLARGDHAKGCGKVILPVKQTVFDSWVVDAKVNLHLCFRFVPVMANWTALLSSDNIATHCKRIDIVCAQRTLHGREWQG